MEWVDLWQLLLLKTLMVEHGGSSASSYLADPTLSYMMMSQDQASLNIIKLSPLLISFSLSLSLTLSRKFADIGHTVSLQYSKGTYHISDWTHVINAHALPGPGIINGLKQVNVKTSCTNKPLPGDEKHSQCVKVGIEILPHRQLDSCLQIYHPRPRRHTAAVRSDHHSWRIVGK